MKRPSSRIRVHEEDGFSLVETLVAFAILALVMTVAVQIVGGGAVRARNMEVRSTALTHAQSRLAGLTASAALSVGRSTGSFSDGYTWELTVAPLLPDTPPTSVAPHLVRIEVTPPRAAAGSVRLTTILLASSDPQP